MPANRWHNPTPACARRVLLALVLSCLVSGCAVPPKTGRHLFILSGQSNMTGTVQQVFTEQVNARFGEANTVVVMRMKSGRGIRFWLADYQPPVGRSFSERAMAENGSVYRELVRDVTQAVGDESFDTAGLIWMQGESDAGNGLSEVYEANFLRLIAHLEEDLGRDDLYFVIGRISDAGLDGPSAEHWERVRAAQVRLAEGDEDGAWVDTDDLNGGGPDNPRGDVHYPREGAEILGRRLADWAIAWIDEHP